VAAAATVTTRLADLCHDYDYDYDYGYDYEDLLPHHI